MKPKPVILPQNTNFHIFEPCYRNGYGDCATHLWWTDHSRSVVHFKCSWWSEDHIIWEDDRAAEEDDLSNSIEEDLYDNRLAEGDCRVLFGDSDEEDFDGFWTDYRTCILILRYQGTFVTTVHWKPRSTLTTRPTFIKVYIFLKLNKCRF